MALVESPEQVQKIVDKMVNLPTLSIRPGLERSEISLAILKRMMTMEPRHLELIDWPQQFLMFGQDALSEIAANDDPWSGIEMGELLIKKGASYGDGPIRSWGELGVAIRLDSKVERLKKLYADNKDVAEDNETFFDTLHDMLGYAVLGYIFSQEQRAERMKSSGQQS